jgi:Icc-related predicted phosphoesterase
VGECLFVSDLHGRIGRYEKLFERIAVEGPEAVFLGGDLLPMPFDGSWASDRDGADFLDDFLVPALAGLRGRMAGRYPRLFLILGNDDSRSVEPALEAAEAAGIWTYIHNRRVDMGAFPVYGYACVPPTPFAWKDWERYDVSRYVDPGCVSPEEGLRSVPVPPHEIRHGTIAADLAALAPQGGLENAILLFHSPPYRTRLDRAALDGRMIDHVPVDVHVGSIAIRRFIETEQPRITLHGHIHESARLTGSWRDRIGRTHLFSAAHDGPELALVRFRPEDPGAAVRTLV